MDDVIVRFAPSPTGYLHIGGARTAIFNWLYARKHGGRFLLRIEDTDAERSSDEAIAGILDGLSWLGLDWDNVPYFQSQFTAEHQDAAKKLLENGRAYKCFCTKAQLDEKREQARKNKTTYQYDGTCRRLTATQVTRKEQAGEPYTIRFKVPQAAGAVRIDDLVYGNIEKRYADIEDFIIVRANGQPLYVLCNAVDDIRDGITHVIRGQDGLANTPKQVLIYQGLGAPLPKFAHMSLTLDPQKAKISKRKHGEQVAVHYYRDHGFLPWAMVNFLVLLGWARADSQEFFTKSELIDAFDLGGINRTNSVFNISADEGKHFTDPKLMNINAHYLRHMPMAELLPFIKARLAKTDLWKPAFETEQRSWFVSTMELIRGRFNTLNDFETYGRAYINDDFIMDETAVRKNLKEAAAGQWLPELAKRLSELKDFESGTIEAELRLFLKDKDIKPGKLMNAVRTAITGQGVGPDFMKVLTVLGRQRVVNRLISAAGISV
ncbi:MAG: glutamate--tRNA ligase [Desulfobacteraceae bacterium]|jgi:glutamyl-tRNA synthetase